MLKFVVIAFALLSLYAEAAHAQAAAPEVSISVIDNKVMEEGQEAPNFATMEISLSAPSDQEVSVKLKTRDGQAVGGGRLRTN